MFLGGTKAKSDFKGYYKALGLDPTLDTVSQEDIKKAFRKSALKYHPDKVIDPGASEAAKRMARERFHLIRTAYETLRDPERRKQYDLGQIQRGAD